MTPETRLNALRVVFNRQILRRYKGRGNTFIDVSETVSSLALRICEREGLIQDGMSYNYLVGPDKYIRTYRVELTDKGREELFK